MHSHKRILLAKVKVYIIISDLVGYIICAVLISCMTILILMVRHRVL